MDTKKLRQKILDLAIRGKLVPQDPNDEPASVLLERIRAEKEQLIKEGKIKRSKKSVTSDTSHYENVPFEVPESWEWVTVGDIFTHNTGKALNSSNSQGEIMSYITTSNLYWNRFDLTVIKEMPFTESEVAKCTVTRGDLLVCEGGDIGRAAIWNYDFDIRIQNHIHRLRSIIQLNHLFYYHVFYLFKSLNLIGGKGVAIQGLSSSDLAKLLVPLPPISEQNRIVSELNRWLSVVDQIELDQYSLKNTIADIKNRILCLAISGKLVGQDISDEPAIELLKKINPSYVSCDNRHYANKPFLIPDSWLWVMGKDLFLPMKNCKPSGDYFKYIDIDSIDNQDCVIKCPKVLPVTAAPSRATRYTQVGDILFSMVRPYLKNIAIVTEGNCIASTGFYVCSPNEALFSKYCYYLMISPYVINGLTQFMKGDNSPSINNAHISEWLYPLPPLNEQKRIVQKIDEIFNYLDSIVAEL